MDFGFWIGSRESKLLLAFFILASLVGRPAAAYSQAQITPVPSPTPQADGRIIYNVAPGDTLTLIALRFQVSLDQLYELNNLGPDSLLTIGEPIILAVVEAGSSGVSPPEYPGAVVLEDGRIVHIVAAGDTLISIALHYNLTLEELYAASGLDEDAILRVGQEVVIGHVPQPQNIGGSADLPGTATPTPTLMPTATPTAPPTATLIVIATVIAPAPFPTAVLPPTFTPSPVVPNNLPTSGNIVVVFWGVVALLAITGGLFLYLGRQR